MNNIAAPRIVAIHGAPRSGTSWLGQLFNSSEQVAYRYQPFFSYAFRGRVDAGSTTAELRQFFSSVLASDDHFVLQRGAAALAGYELAFDKRAPTHLVYKEVRFHNLIEPILERIPEMHAVGLVRDPRAVIASWIAAPREFNPEWEVEKEWRFAPSKNAGHPENWYGFSRWRELASLFLGLEKKFPGRFSLIRYEDLVCDTLKALGGVFDAVGLPLTQQVQSFVSRSRREDDGAVYGVLRDAGKSKAIVLNDRVRAAIEAELRGDPVRCFLDPRINEG